jgi:O-antigen/teichoic acid export membrane protein
MLIVCILAVPLSFVLPILYGSAFAGVPLQILILLPGVFLLGIETVQVQFFNSLGVPRAIPAFWIVTVVISVGLNLVVVPSYGAVGAAGVSTIAYALMFFLVAAYFRLHTKRSIREAFVIDRAELGAMLDPRRTLLAIREGKA